MPNVEANPIPDERRTAPAVREWSSVRREQRSRQRAADHSALARKLYTDGLSKAQIAEILGVHWAQVDRVLSGTA